MFIYKVCTETLWYDAVRAGAFKGAPVDLADGYIHFSTQEQLGETLKRHFGGQSGLVLIEIEAARLGDKLKWEPSRGGALFPHLYGDLPLSAVAGKVVLRLDEKSRHLFPAGF